MHRTPRPRRASRPSRRRASAVLGGALLLGLALPPLTATAAAASTAPTDPPETFTSVNLAADRTDANFFYRIPALTHLGDGVVLASWDARPGSAADAPNPNSIMERRSTDNGRTWGAARIVAAGKPADASGPRFGYSDPSYVVDRETGTVFNFFVYSKDQGFFGSAYGDDDADRQVISSAVISSTDGGLTWSEPRLITEVTKTSTGSRDAQGVYQPAVGDVRANFATSGEGIQLRYGPYAGRLIQQYAGTIRQSDGSTRIQAYSVYSDDHGATWQRGAAVGTGMDENKVVELSDGRVMLNSRDSDNGRQRKIAISTDGGHSYGPVTRDAELPDPTNNASIIRMHPDAPAGSPDAKKLLFTNANNGLNGNRVNGAVRVSCDDGESWPGLRTLAPGFFAYSSATVLDDGRFGVLWERNYSNDMQFSTFDEAWLDYVCAPLTAAPLAAQAGQPATLRVTVANQEAQAISGSLTVASPAGWSATGVAVNALAPGSRTEVSLPLSVPAGLQGQQRLQMEFTTADGRSSQATAIVELPVTSAGLTLSSSLTSSARDVTIDPYEAGDVLSYSLRVTSTSGFPTLVTPASSTFTTGFAPTACRWSNLAALGAYTCSTPRVQLTQADIDRGWFVPEYAMTVAPMTNTAAVTTVQHRGAPVALRDGALAATITGDRADAGRDVVSAPYAVGDAVPYRFSVTNDTPLSTSITPVSGEFAPFLPPGAGNCRYLSLPGLGSYTCGTPRHVVTEDEHALGFFAPVSRWQLSAPGQSTRTVGVVGAEVDLRERALRLDGALELSWIDVDGDGWLSVGDRIAQTARLTNAGTVRMTDVALGPDEVARLDVADSTVSDSVRAITAEEILTGRIGSTPVAFTARNGERSVAGEVDAVELDLSANVVPAWSATAEYRADELVAVDGVRYLSTRPSRGEHPVETISAWRPETARDGAGASWWAPRPL